ncbi:MAG: MFS transporter [Cyclobacteriaceae bacterium]|nr:MFS transporter [Cyclobacteriaceae bacterium]
MTQAGLINNLNDGMAWGIFPILLASKSFMLEQIGIVTAVYPAVWGIGQLFTGKMADNFCKKDMLFTGMFLQAVALLLFAWADSMFHSIALDNVRMGYGHGLSDDILGHGGLNITHPQDRAKSIGIFRLWRDIGLRDWSHMSRHHRRPYQYKCIHNFHRYIDLDFFPDYQV